MRIGYFTGGTAGAGHVVRGLAVRAGLQRAGFDGEWAMFGPPLPFPKDAMPAGYRAVRVDPVELRNPVVARESGLARALVEFRPDLLIVDRFWAPLYNILPDLRTRAWLLLDCVPRQWMVGARGAEFRPGDFERIIAIEPLNLPHLTDSIDPVVVCNRDECMPAGSLRIRLGVGDRDRLTVVVQAGLQGEATQLANTVAGRAGARTAGIGRSDFGWAGGGAAVSPDNPFAGGGASRDRCVTLDLYKDANMFPAAPWLADADRIVTGAGYNAFWEARWLGYAGRTEFHALPRRIDNQAWRLESCRRHPMNRNGADVLAGMILGPG